MACSARTLAVVVILLFAGAVRALAIAPADTTVAADTTAAPPDTIVAVPKASADSVAVARKPWWKIPITSHARLDLRLTADEATAPWSWDAQSRSPLDLSRFMIDALAGNATTGLLYAKGAATWQNADDAAGHIDFAIEQGDYLYRFEHAEVRAFGDERRFFTYDLGTPFMDDDVVEDYQHRIGVRADGGTNAIGGSLLVADIDEGNETHLTSYGKVRAAWRALAGSVSYRHQEGDAVDNAILKGEAAAYWKRFSAIGSVENSGFDSGAFVPEFDDGHSAAFVEVRAARFGISDAATFSGVYRYRKVDDFYANELSSLRWGTLLHRLGLYVSSRRYALDGRVVVFSGHENLQPGLEAPDDRGIEASARAWLRDNSEMNVRALVVDHEEVAGADEPTSGVVHAIYRRSLSGFMGGVSALVDGIGLEAQTHVGAEMRINWNATSAFYMRWIASDDVERSDAIYARLEFRPTLRTWVTLAYGRESVGDGPYFLEDDDSLPTIDTEDVISITVRGDF